MAERNGPPSPALAAAKGEPWGDLVPLDNPVGAIPQFPLSVFPRALQDLCAQSAESVGCPVDYPAGHALAVAAGAIGASYDLQVKRGYLAPSNLWVCVIAPPGSGKSPSVGPILAPVFEEQSYRRDAKKPPVYVSDVTVEKLAAFLTDCARGLLMVWDEMAGWLTSFNQYKSGKGNDRSHYLSIWDGRALKTDRKNPDAPGVFVLRPRLSICGGIQPEVLDELRAGPADGLFDRMLFCYPADPGLVTETWAEVDDAPCREWAKALRELWSRPMKQGEGLDLRPNVVQLAEEARPVWQAWTEELALRARQETAPHYFRAVAAKIQGYAARLALVVHLVGEAYGESRDLGVKAEDMLRGVALAEYFLGHADRVYQAAGRDKRLNQARAIMNWAVAFKGQKWTRGDAWARLRNNSLFGKPEDLTEPLRLLQLHNVIRWAADEQAGQRGRPTKGCYETNPALWDASGASAGGTLQPGAGSGGATAGRTSRKRHSDG